MTIRVWLDDDAEAGRLAFRAKVMCVGFERAIDKGTQWQMLTLTAPHLGLIQMVLEERFALDRT